MSARQSMETTVSLLERVRLGDDEARERLVARFLPILRRWARGRLPPRARGSVDTDDVVQVSLIRAVARLDSFEPTREGAFLAYLRRIVLNAIRDEIRRNVARPGTVEADETLLETAPSALERAIGRQAVERYEEALMKLDEVPREAVILRVEFGYSHQEVADAIGSPSANAARMMVSRALVRLAEILGAPA